VHLLAVWAVPRVIMQRVMSMAVPERTDGVFLPPMTDATQRRIVMPSPDLLYASCSFDLGERPLRIRADPKTPHYWSIALYAANSDNFFVLNDRRAQGRSVDLVLVGPAAYAAAPSLPEGATLVAAPSQRGLLLMRVLVADYATERDVVEAARRSLRCEAL
jgi:uncharacterized membrane protein